MAMSMLSKTLVFPPSQKLINPQNPKKSKPSIPRQSPSPFYSFSRLSSRISASVASTDSHRLVEAFDPRIPLEEALTPPSSWYTDPSFFALEFNRVFFRGWQAAGMYIHSSFLDRYLFHVRKDFVFFFFHVEVIAVRIDEGFWVLSFWIFYWEQKIFAE